MKQRSQAEQSKYLLTETLLEMMETQAFESITIKALTERAGISRLTYYRHFQSKEDVILAHISLVFERYFNEIRKHKTLTLKTALVLCFSYWRNDERLAKLLVKHQLTGLLYQSFSKYLEVVLSLAILPYEISHFQKKFIEGGLVTVMIDWMSYSNDKSETEVADLIIELVSILE